MLLSTLDRNHCVDWHLVFAILIYNACLKRKRIAIPCAERRELKILLLITLWNPTSWRNVYDSSVNGVDVKKKKKTLNLDINKNIDVSGMTDNGFHLWDEPFYAMLLYVHVKWIFARRTGGERVYYYSLKKKHWHHHFRNALCWTVSRAADFTTPGLNVHFSLRLFFKLLGYQKLFPRV